MFSCGDRNAGEIVLCFFVCLSRMSTSKTMEKPKKKRTEDDPTKDLRPTTRTIRKQGPAKSSNVQNPPAIRTTNALNSKKDHSTASNSRITKTKYFPDKSLYTNALKRNEKEKAAAAKKDDRIVGKASNMREKKPDTNEASTRKITTAPSSEATSIERPRTATLKRGKIVNSNIVGPDVPKEVTSSRTPTGDYEDDFESYESDFESNSSSQSASSSSLHLDNISEDTSSDELIIKKTELLNVAEERKLDSGTFDLPDKTLHQHNLDKIKEIVPLENTTPNCLISLTDEGYEEDKSSLQSEKFQYLNFVAAQKQIQTNKTMQKYLERGRKILGMIKLDCCNFTLYDFPSLTYDEFIKTFGRSDSIQVAAQTGDDNIDEETQTSAIETTSKWTQFPTTCSNLQASDFSLEQFREELQGVGEDGICRKPNEEGQYNAKRLGKFIDRVGRVVLSLLDEGVDFAFEKIEQHQGESVFSEGYITFDHTFSILEDLYINFVAFSVDTSKMLSVHCNLLQTGKAKYLKSVICLWNKVDPKLPERLLTSQSQIHCCQIVLDAIPFVIGGSNDGLLIIWNLRSVPQERIQLFSNASPSNVPLQKPTIMTDIGSGHNGKVIAIEVLSIAINNLQTNQIYSLDEDGAIITWSIVFDAENSYYERQIVLIQNMKISLNEMFPALDNLQCTDMCVNKLDVHHLLITTNYGCVLHCLSNGAKSKPSKFSSDCTTSQANCINCCSFSPLYFFVGHDDGTIALYSRLYEKPLMTMSNKDTDFVSGIECLQWSQSRPCIFYVKDTENAVHIWNLAVSDLFPICSIPLKKTITYMKLVPCSNRDTKREMSYMVLADKNGLIYLHALNSEHRLLNAESYQNDIKIFSNYVNRL